MSTKRTGAAGSKCAQIQSLENRALFSGGLDPTFNGGYVNGPAAPVSTGYENSADAMQSDGKLLVASNTTVGTTYGNEVIRFLANGSLDSTFGVNGSANLGLNATVVSIVESAAGKIDVAEDVSGGGTIVIQLTSAGKLDTSFGTKGQATLPTGFAPGKIIVDGTQLLLIGNVFTSPNTNTGALVRLNTNGSPDSTFGANGLDVLAGTATVNSAFVAPSGEMAISLIPTSGVGAELSLLHTNGSVDASFGTGGYFTGLISNFNNEGLLRLVGVGPGSDLVFTEAVARNDFNEFTYEFARLTATGSLDSTFTPVQMVYVGNPTGFIPSALESDGSLLVADGSSPATVTHYSTAGKLLQTSVTINDAFDPSQVLPLSNGSYLLASGLSVFKLTAAGVADQTFGTYGVLTAVTTQYTPSEYSAVDTQSTRKVIAVGPAGGLTGYFVDLTRYNVNGSVDTTFGTNGVTLTGFGDQSVFGAIQLLVEPNDKIIVATTVEQTQFGAAEPGVAIARYNSNGTIDKTFGTAGTVLFANDQAPVLLWQNGKLVVGSQSTVRRLNDSGSVDSTFAKGLPGGASAMAVQPDGKIVIGFDVGDDIADTSDTVVSRYGLNGLLDKTFGTQGSVTFANSIPDQIVVEPAGRIVVMTTEFEVLGPPGAYDLNALLPSGSSDSTFGNSGMVQIPSGTPFGAIATTPSLIQQPNGQLLAVTTGAIGYESPTYAAVTRFSANGVLDTTFGKGGTSDIGSTQTPGFRGSLPLGVGSYAALDSAGRLLLAGGNGPNSANIFAIDTNNDTGTITGYMFYDFNGNGVRDPGDHALNWTCYIDVDNDGQFDNADIRIYTDSAGNFVIPNLAPGVYHIRQSQVAHWVKTTAAEFTVTVTAGDTVSGVDFGSYAMPGWLS